MSEHMRVKHELKHIGSLARFEGVLSASTLSSREKDVIREYYIENRDFGFIADELGFSEANVLKMHRRSLEKLSSLV